MMCIQHFFILSQITGVNPTEEEEFMAKKLLLPDYSFVSSMKNWYLFLIGLFLIITPKVTELKWINKLLTVKAPGTLFIFTGFTWILFSIIYVYDKSFAEYISKTCGLSNSNFSIVSWRTVREFVNKVFGFTITLSWFLMFVLNDNNEKSVAVENENFSNKLYKIYEIFWCHLVSCFINFFFIVFNEITKSFAPIVLLHGVIQIFYGFYSMNYKTKEFNEEISLSNIDTRMQRIRHNPLNKPVFDFISFIINNAY